jgi:hypothetical protein
VELMTDIQWLARPEDHDFDAAEQYLSLISAPDERVHPTIARLRTAAVLEHQKAKDILRASGLPLLGVNDFHVARDIRKVRDGKKLSPILLVRGNALEGIRLQIADGYHRVCACYQLDANTDIPCLIGDWTGGNG